MIERDNTNRRGFLKKLWGILGIVASVEVVAMSLSFLSPLESKNKRSGLHLKATGMISDIPNGSVLPFRSGKFYLVRLEDGGFIALSLICSHLGCSVQWDKAENKFICPCHSSQFDIRGNVMSRPAPRALDYYPVIIREGEVLVDTSTPVRRRTFDKTQVTYA